MRGVQLRQQRLEGLADAHERRYPLLVELRQHVLVLCRRLTKPHVGMIGLRAQASGLRTEKALGISPRGGGLDSALPSVMRAVGLAIVVSLSIASSGVKTDKQPVEVEMRNVGLHLTPDISVQIHHLRGRFVAEGARQIPYLDDPTS